MLLHLRTVALRRTQPMTLDRQQTKMWMQLQCVRLLQLLVTVRLTLLRLKSGGRRSQKTGLRERRDACINERTNHCFECTTCRYASLGMFTISRQGRALSYDARSSRPRTSQGQQNNFGYITGFWLFFSMSSLLGLLLRRKVGRSTCSLLFNWPRAV